MENTTNMVQVEVEKKIRGTEALLDTLPKSFVRNVSEKTGYTETHIANIIRGKRYPKNPKFLETTVRIADMYKDFEQTMNELLKPFENAKSNKNRI